MAEPVFSALDIKKSYGTDVVTEVLHGISLQLEAGSFSGLIGPSGSGKTTLLNLIGLLDKPTSGQISLAGISAHELNEVKTAGLRSKYLGFIFQFHHLLPQFTVLENVMLPGWIAQGMSDSRQREKARGLLSRMGLESLADKKAGSISGGQQQRVAIARALVNSPTLVLADEPTGNLDTENSETVFELLRQINREDKTSFLIVTHDRHIAAKTDRVIELVDGRILKDEAILSSQDAWKSLAPDYCAYCGKNKGALSL